MPRNSPIKCWARYLELSDATGRRHKFYEVTIRGALGRVVVRLRWGRIETDGQNREHVFEFAQDARRFAQARVAAKRRAGYALAQPGQRPRLAPPKTADGRQQDLETYLKTRRPKAAPMRPVRRGEPE